MFNKFTERGRKVMSLARQEAQRLGREVIGTEHLLLGIILEGEGPAARLLKNLAVDGKGLYREIEKLILPSTSPSAGFGQIPFSPRAKRVIELANEACDALGHEAIRTEHLLLGLLKENQGIGAQALIGLGLKLDEVRDMVLEGLGAEAAQLEGEREASRFPFERLTPLAEAILRKAREEALQRPCSSIGTDSILLGILLGGDGVAARIMNRLGVSLEPVREAILRDAPPEPPPPVAVTQLPFSPRSTYLLMLAVQAGQVLGQDRIGDELLLLALIMDSPGLPYEVLVRLGVRPDAVRNAVLDALGWTRKPGDPPTA